MLKVMRGRETFARASWLGLALGVTMAAQTAGAATSSALATPRLFLEPLSQRALGGLFVATELLDMRRVQDHPVVRARREYSRITALPVVVAPEVAPLPVLSTTQTWQLSRSVLLTFPLAITGRSVVTAEIAGAGRVALMPTGFAEGGVLTFTGAF
jgi:hypothetical protein